jgi:hypothetical protein
VLAFGLAAVAILVPHVGLAQNPQQPVSSGLYVHANQIGIDGGSVIAFGLSYARRVGNRPLLVGGRVGYAFEENINSFDRNVWDVFGVDGFVRLMLHDAIHGDLGFSALGFSPEDDTDVRGTFLGLYTAVMVGYRFVFVGSEFRLGLASVAGGSEAGVIVSPRVRVLVPWAR